MAATFAMTTPTQSKDDQSTSTPSSDVRWFGFDWGRDSTTPPITERL
jgi:hypothetical protein